jgi:maleylacetoacetate isomerase
MKLYTYFRSSAAFRVRIALNLKGVEYEAVPIHLGRDEHRDDRYREVNPQGLVPAIEDNGVVLSQSLAIIEYLDTRYPEPQLLPEDPVERAHVQSLAQLIACDTHPLNNLRVLKYLRAELGLDEPAVERWYRHWVAESFRGLEVELARSSGPYCVGAEISLADVCLVPQVFNARRFGCDLAPYPRLLDIASRLEEHEAFRAAAPGNQPDAG